IENYLKKMRWLLKLTSSTIVVSILCIAAGIIAAWCGSYIVISPTLPHASKIAQIQSEAPLKIYNKQGQLIGRFGSKSRKTIKYKDTPKLFKQALLAAEDDRFFKHKGVDPQSIMRAVSSYFNPEMSLSGGSTITMQLAKLLFLNSDKTIARKLRQIFIALHLENHHTKQEILQLYMNKIYLGHQAYGVQSAANTYYNRNLDQLTLAEMAMIAGIPKAPSINNPVSNTKAAINRRNWILKRMYHLGNIDYLAYTEAMKAPNTAKKYVKEKVKLNPAFSYPAEEARRQAIELLGDEAYTGSYSIHTTIHSDLQLAAQASVKKGLLSYHRRHGYRGPEQKAIPSSQWQGVLDETPTVGNQHPAIVTDVSTSELHVILKNGQRTKLSWGDGLSSVQPFLDTDRIARRVRNASQIANVGDLIRVKPSKTGWRFTEIPKAQAALIAIAPQNGEILAMIGGYDYKVSEFNRATQAKRQPGSTIKPIVYAAAMELKGYTAASLINDKPLRVSADNGGWQPNNASNRFYGQTSLRKALSFSRNVVTVKLLQKVGIENFLDYQKNFGIKTKKGTRHLSIALGTNNSTPQEIANVFADIANGGYHIQPHLITRIRRHGKTVYVNNTPKSCVMCYNHFTNPDPAAGSGTVTLPSSLLSTRNNQSIAKKASRNMDARVNYIIDSILGDVIEKGTAQDAKVLGRKDIRGKTGTTNGPVDAWFAGYQHNIAAVTWLGFDRGEKIGEKEFGGTAALPIWIDFMKTALKDVPEKIMPQPDGIVRLPVNPSTGKAIARSTKYSLIELFRHEKMDKPEPKKSKEHHEIKSKKTIQLSDVPIYDTQAGTYVDDSYDLVQNKKLDAIKRRQKAREEYNTQAQIIREAKEIRTSEPDTNIEFQQELDKLNNTPSELQQELDSIQNPPSELQQEFDSIQSTPSEPIITDIDNTLPHEEGIYTNLDSVIAEEEARLSKEIEQESNIRFDSEPELQPLYVE
ncbi:MAG: PBP1A family penicillin-binding protein, partial [Pseudomonadota bacterium]